MRSSIVRKTPRDLRQEYVQQYLKLFLRRVHPDLFQNYPKEQLRNSASLQDLLPWVNHEKSRDTDAAPSTSSSSASESSSKRLVFYFKPDGIRPSLSQPAGSASDISQPVTVSQQHLHSAEHTLSIDDAKQSKSEKEVRSWQMVQSFLELCRKVGVPIKEPDQQDITRHLDLSVQEADSRKQSAQQRTPQKPLSEVFQEELQSSFSGSVGSSSFSSAGVGAGIEASGEHISQTQLGKIGGAAPVLEAQLMIKSNPLLFKSPELSSARFSKVVRTWIHWQKEDERLIASSDGASTLKRPFRLADWWRKVPIMVMSSAQERSEALMSQGPAGRGLLVVHQEMSKQDMADYLWCNLERTQSEYKEMLRAASPSASSSSSSSPSSISSDQQGRDHAARSSASSPLLSPEAASYLERMRTKAQLQNASARSSTSGGGCTPNKK